jgi:hypothetical protein
MQFGILVILFIIFYRVLNKKMLTFDFLEKIVILFQTNKIATQKSSQIEFISKLESSYLMLW